VTGPRIAGLLLLVLARVPAEALAQEAPPPNYLEFRAGSSDGSFYRYAEFSRPIAGPVVFDAVYLGVPGQNELYLGAGYALKATPTLILTPLVYTVIGKENGQRGLALGTFALGTIGDWSVYTFVGYFEPLAGDVSRYLFVDTLDLARKLGRWEVGLSAGAFVTGGDCTCVAGPILVRNDPHGSWRASIRAGSSFDARLVRTLSF
jgi:hypothetical protein